MIKVLDDATRRKYDEPQLVKEFIINGLSTILEMSEFCLNGQETKQYLDSAVTLKSQKEIDKQDSQFAKEISSDGGVVDVPSRVLLNPSTVVYNSSRINRGFFAPDRQEQNNKQDVEERKENQDSNDDPKV